MPRLRKLGLVLMLACLALPAAAQEALVLVESNVPGALVYADTVLVGRVGQGAFRLRAGTYRLRLLPPGGDAWSIRPVEHPVTLAPGDTVLLDLPFPYHYQIESTPSGADVYLEAGGQRAWVGQTPFRSVREAPYEGTFRIEYPDHAAASVPAGRQVWNRQVVLLEPLTPPAATAAMHLVERPRRRWIDAVALGTAVAAGAVAVHYKFKADRLYDDYLETTDPALRPQIKANDTRSAVALGVMQAGVAVFAVRLVFR